MRSNRFVAAVMIPIFASIFLFMVLPLFLGLTISLYDYNPLNASNPFVGLQNFQRLFVDDVFKIALKNTLYFVFITVSINVFVTLVIASVISNIPSRRISGFFRVVYFMPCVAPLIASSMVWGQLYNTKNGLINLFLKTWFNLAPRNWLGNPDTLLPAIIIFTIWADIGYNIIIFSAGIDGIPSDFFEAADIDGAGAIRKFFFITLPLLGRTISFVIVMTLISHFQMFAQFQSLAGGLGGSTAGPNNAGMVLTLYIYKTAFQYKNMGYASAVAIILFLLIMAFTAVSQRLSRVDWGY